MGYESEQQEARMHPLPAVDREPGSRPPRRTLADQIRSLGLPPRQKVTELDSTGCDQIDARAMQLLATAVRRFSANGRTLVVRHASPALRRQLIQEGLACVLRAPRSGR
jgi:MFS superfamily sulfate permease-like transporter